MYCVEQQKLRDGVNRRPQEKTCTSQVVSFLISLTVVCVIKPDNVAVCDVEIWICICSIRQRNLPFIPVI